MTNQQQVVNKIGRQTILLKLNKGPEARFISHLDLMRALERAVRRADLPIAYSEGFNPHMKISFASALALGATSEGELVEVVVTGSFEPEALMNRLNEHLPLGIQISAAGYSPEGKSLADSVEWAEYILGIEYGGADSEFNWASLLDGFWKADEVMIERTNREGRKQVFNLKPLIRDLKITGQKGSLVVLKALMKAGSRGNARPEDLVKGLALIGEAASLTLRSIHRVRLFGDENGRPTPLDQGLHTINEKALPGNDQGDEA